MKYRRSKNSKPIPVLLDDDLRTRIEETSKKMGEPKSTVMRIAMRIGLQNLEKALEQPPQKNLSSLIYPSGPDKGAELNEEKPKKKAG